MTTEPVPPRHFRHDLTNALISVGTAIITCAAILAFIFGPETIVRAVMGP